MVWMLENDGVEVLDLGVVERVGDRMTVVLISNGRNIEVTDAIKHEYLEHKFEHLLLLRTVVCAEVLRSSDNLFLLGG
ncbi:hypothetical protein PF004_g21517 [Phytophthora fragariae]|nr:hypothetical protein PF009_g29604 [Phytophthora fragariae]KAE9191731.1 hypothetical protein PF004_g21517 [Phytophthora fragariae]KAE9287905.1 hypothetical protein PF008_g26281 [Phytophthora fragariae]